MIKKIYQFVVGGIKNDFKVLLLYILSFLNGSKPSKINVMDEAILKKHVKDGKTLIRLGDGEVMLMMGRSIHFQSVSSSLTTKLREIMNGYTNEAGYCLGIPTDQVLATETELISQKRLRIWRLFRTFANNRLPTNMDYYSAVLFYHQGKFEKIIAPHLENKHVICVSRREILDNVLLNYLKGLSDKVSFITVPNKDSFSQIEKTKKLIQGEIEKTPDIIPVILLAAGPASKIIALDFSKEGVQSVDLGHGMEIIGRNLDYSTRI